MSQAKISLDQWAAFKAVVDEGSFARAAEVLNKSQSSVSYAVANMESLLPTPIFNREGRKAELTEAGKVLYRQAASLLKQAAELEKSAAYLAGGWEAEVTLGIDAVVPMDRLFCALQKFSLHSPQTRLRLLETTLSGTAETLLNRTADIAILAFPPPGFSAIPLTQIRMIAVASSDHELFTLGHDISEEELKHYRQIVLRDTGIKRQIDTGWLGSEQRWTMSHPASSLEAVKAGLGFAFLPHDRIKHALDAGEIRPLPLAWGAERVATLNLVMKDRAFAGPATRAVADMLIREFQVTPG